MSSRKQQPERATDDELAYDPLTPCDEQLAVRRWRYQAARRAGLTVVEAEMFADGDGDLALLRRLASAGCPSALIAGIVL